MNCCKLAKYGKKELILASIGAEILCFLVLWLLPPVIAAVVVPFVAAVWGWVLWFFRDPDRQTPAGEGLFISPADGRITDITNIGPQSMLGCDGIQIGIFMNVFDVHVNRSPCDGVVRRVEHFSGQFLNARDPATAQSNESSTVYLTHSRNGREYPIVFRQIAGLIARRIVTDLAQGQSLSRGQRIGMIKFGSRMEVQIPKELAGEICVSLGRHVLAGLTVLARTVEKST